MEEKKKKKVEVYEVLSSENPRTSKMNPKKVNFDIRKRLRPDTLNSLTIERMTGCGTLYVTIGWDENGVFEVFATLGKAGQCQACSLEAVTRAVTLGLRYSIPVKNYIKILSSIQCPKPITFPKKLRTLSCYDALASVLRQYEGGQLWKQNPK